MVVMHMQAMPVLVSEARQWLVTVAATLGQRSELKPRDHLPRGEGAAVYGPCPAPVLCSSRHHLAECQETPLPGQSFRSCHRMRVLE